MQYADYCAIVGWDFLLSCHEHVPNGLAASFWFGQIGGVAMDHEYHAAGFVCGNCILLGCHIVKELEAFLHDCFCWVGYVVA